MSGNSLSWAYKSAICGKHCLPFGNGKERECRAFFLGLSGCLDGFWDFKPFVWYYFCLHHVRKPKNVKELALILKIQFDKATLTPNTDGVNIIIPKVLVGTFEFIILKQHGSNPIFHDPQFPKKLFLDVNSRVSVPLKIMLLQSYEVLWIHNIDAIFKQRPTQQCVKSYLYEPFQTQNMLFKIKVEDIKWRDRRRGGRILRNYSLLKNFQKLQSWLSKLISLFSYRVGNLKE